MGKLVLGSCRTAWSIGLRASRWALPVELPHTPMGPGLCSTLLGTCSRAARRTSRPSGHSMVHKPTEWGSCSHLATSWLALGHTSAPAECSTATSPPRVGQDRIAPWERCASSPARTQTPAEQRQRPREHRLGVRSKAPEGSEDNDITEPRGSSEVGTSRSKRKGRNPGRRGRAVCQRSYRAPERQAWPASALVRNGGDVEAAPLTALSRRKPSPLSDGFETPRVQRTPSLAIFEATSAPPLELRPSVR
jgi:hypothetical protein